ncbi:MAG: choline kinase [Desulfuromonas sp.]|nr:MAG: choline kinase [Desulfuromonas sp.]
MLSRHFRHSLRDLSQATRIKRFEPIQELWSGYGQILRCHLSGGRWPSLVVKHICPTSASHPRGWNSDLSHQRKVRSYSIEIDWYHHWSHRCGDDCRIARCHKVEQRNNQTLIVLEDLDAAGYPRRLENPGPHEIHACLRWLAAFHARFMGEAPQHLWPQGTYWHLATRPDELAILDDPPLKEAAAAIDALLEASPYQTFVHGDAKVANFCFSEDGDQVASVDFQYVGGGCGMKDVAYFIGSCLDERECERQEEALLAVYFEALRQALTRHRPKIDAAALEQNWRELYPVAWSDFYRFLKGWAPGHWKLHAYSERLANETIARLNSEA